MEGILPAQGNEGFDLLVKAAAAVEEDAKTLITRSDWTPGTRKRALATSARGLGLLNQGLNKKAKFAFRPYAPDQTRPSVRGWRFLGMALAWRAEDAAESGNFAAATDNLLTALRFGSVLQGADTSVAGLGISIATTATKKVWGYFPKMSAGDLQSLGVRVAGVLRQVPSAVTTAKSERVTMMASVEWVLDAFKSGQVEIVGKALGKPAAAAIRHMKGLSTDSKSEQVSFFVGMIGEGRAEAADLIERASAQRYDSSDWAERQGDRPWRRLSTALFRPGRYFLEQRARFDAEMRLFSLDAQLLSRFKRTRSVPSDLSRLARWLRTDPFSGRDFVYLAQGSDYKLYSVGVDGLDNGGQGLSSSGKEDITTPR